MDKEGFEMKLALKAVVTNKKPEPVSNEYREEVRAHARRNRYNPDSDPVLQEFKRKMRSLRIGSM